MRPSAAHGHHRVTYVELFFDLVFVFAVTQTSHTLLHRFSPLGIAETTLLFLAVWWVWIYTSWVTNWLDPERTSIRLMLFALMVAGLVLSMSIPKAFDSRGLAFALAYVAMQVGRSVWTWFAIPASEAALKLNFIRISIWLAVSGVAWILGGLAGGDARLAWWVVALAIEYLSPFARFWTPGLGATRTEEWSVEGGHMAERCALFIIIALGESLLVSGATFAELAWTAPATGAFLAAFFGSVAMWWIYFHKGAEAGAERISQSRDPGRVARLAYTYLHLPIVAGIIVSAVGDEVALAHPAGHSDLKAALSIAGGALLFLFGATLFKHTIHGRWQLSHLAGMAALIAAGLLASAMSSLALSATTSLILVVVALWEAISIGDKPTLERRAER